MDKINYFNYSALAIMLVLVVVIRARHMLNGRRNRYFWNLLMVVFVAVLFEVESVIQDGSAMGNVVEKYIAHSGYLVLYSLTVPVYVIYLACLTDSMHKLHDSIFFQLLLSIPYVSELLLILTTSVTHWIFYIDEAGTYTRGPGYIFIYIVASFYIGIGVVYALRCRRLFEPGQLISMVIIFPLMIAALLFQMWHPQLRVEMIVQALCILFILLMVQKPEERTDPLTGFGKANAYANDIDQAIANNKPIRIILINILNYKALRNIMGYNSMNQLIHIVSKNIMTVCREKLPKADPYYLDRGRFCLIVNRDNFKKMDEAAQALNELFQREINLQGMEINLQSNLCTIRCPEDFQDYQSLFAFSNEFEEYNKTGRIMTAEEILKDGGFIIRDMEDIINNAFNKEGISVYYQPIYSVKEKRYASAEALIRLNDEEYGHISPELFIPVAEKSGVIHKIGSFVLEEVCKFIASEEFAKLEVDYIEVNLSVAQCMRNNLAEEILGLLKKYQVRPEQINLEITETAVSNSQTIMSENIRILAEAGIPFSLDDFGTGYSNIRRMATLPLHIVKLDKSFTDLEDNPKLEIVVRNTVQMIKEMGMQIVVEGIENEKLVKVFSDLECEYIQGFYFSKPLTRAEFVDFVERSNHA